MDMQLNNKTALVTGASVGIGRGIAKALAAEGVRVAVSARRVDKLRELAEETGFVATPVQSPTVLDAKPDELLQPGVLRPWPHSLQYEIFEHWRHRYPPGVTHNTEHWFVACVPADFIPQLAADEHVGYAWLSAKEAADRCFSPNNAQAILELSARLQAPSA